MLNSQFSIGILRFKPWLGPQPSPANRSSDSAVPAHRYGDSGPQGPDGAEKLCRAGEGIRDRDRRVERTSKFWGISREGLGDVRGGLKLVVEAPERVVADFTVARLQT